VTGAASDPLSLPKWERGTPAVLVVAGPHAIPVSTAVRAGDRRVLLALGRRRETLARLRADPEACLCLLGAGVAFTAFGRARVLLEELPEAPVAALELDVERVQDHLADGRTEMLDGARWRWRDPAAAEADTRVAEGLQRLAAGNG
jgi:hypothetical protein